MLYISARSLFREFLPVAELTDATKAPADLLWAVHLGAGTWLAYRPDGIIGEVRSGPTPRMAANVRIAWPDREDGQTDYSFVDTLSVPQLKVTNRQIITFRQLDFGDMVAHDDVEGTSGRPLSGILGAIFDVIGEASIKYSRSAVASDGVQVMSVKAKKVFSVTPTVTVYPDGRGEKDLPSNRPDLGAIESRLQARHRDRIPPVPVLVRQVVTRRYRIDASARSSRNRWPRHSGQGGSRGPDRS